MNDPIRKAGLLLPVLRNSAESWGNHHCAGELRRAIELIEELSTETPATAHGEDCETCKGRGMVVHWEQIAEDDAIEHEYECPVCDGAGKAPGHVQHYIAALIERATKAEHLASEYARQAVMRGLTERFTPTPPAGGFVVDRDAVVRQFQDAMERKHGYRPTLWDNGDPINGRDCDRLEGFKLALAASPTAQPSAKDGVRESVDDVLRMLLAERNHRTDGDTWTLADRARHLSRGDKCLINELESEATTAAGLVDDAMVKRALNAQPFVAENVATRVWQLITGGVTNSERAMRAALEAALGREVGV